MSKKNMPLLKYMDIVQAVRIEHSSYALVTRELEFAYESIGYTATPVCRLITGESRTGKSCVVDDFVSSHRTADEGGEDNSIRSIVYAVAPEKATVKSLVQSLLRGLGDPQWDRGTQSSQTQRLYTLLDGVRCKLIVLDEFQHLCDKGQKHKLAETADWLKVLLESKKYGLIAVGLPESAAVVNNHSQLVQRFDCELRMPRFDWHDAALAAQFRGILHKFQHELEPFVFPDLATPEMGLRMYFATTGRVGVLAKLLERSVHDAIRKGTKKIRIDDLAEAYARAVWKANEFPIKGGPFCGALEAMKSPAVAQVIDANAASEPSADLSAKVELYGTRRQEGPDKGSTSNGGAARPATKTPQRRHQAARERTRIKREVRRTL